MLKEKKNILQLDKYHACEHSAKDNDEKIYSSFVTI